MKRIRGGTSAENRIISVDGGSTATYVYDAEGRRIKTQASEYLYDLAGHSIAVLDAVSGAWNTAEIYAGGTHLATYSGGAGGTTTFNHADWLGTERLRTSVSAAIGETCTSLPFGDGLSCSGTESSKRHFTGKERDAESGLDNFGARYDSSSMGRFMTPDPSMESVVLRNPQSWNRYSYTLNNPLRYIDPTGEVWVAAEKGGGYNWQDTCNKDQTCFNSISAVQGNNLVIYGSNNAQDVTTIQANDKGYVDLNQVTGQHDADFTVKDGAASFLNLKTASDFFNTTEKYKDENSGNDKLLVTEAGNPDGSQVTSPVLHKTHDLGRSVDVLYQDANGSNLHGNSAAANADVGGTSNLVDAAKQNGFNQNYSARPKDFGTQYATGHKNHLHLGKTRPPNK